MPKPPAVFGQPIPGSEVEGSTPAYRHPDFVNGLFSIDDPSMDTVWKVFETAAKKFPDSPCHGMRAKGEPFVFKTYNEVYQRILKFARGVHEFIEMDETDQMRLMGLMGTNHTDWFVAEMACTCQSGTTVPVYNTTPQEVLEHLFTENGCAVIVCDGPSVARLVAAKSNIARLKLVIVYGETTEEHKSAVENAGMSFMTFDQVVQKGESKSVELIPPTPETIFSFIFTSGSTGMPKGALLSHAAQTNTIIGVYYNLKQCGLDIKPGDYHLSYLPSAHVMERGIQTNIYFYGGAVAFFQGSRELLLDDLKTLRPTLWPSVPRLLNLIYDQIMNKVKTTSKLKQSLFNKALAAKVAGLRNGKLNHKIWDALVFKKIKKSLGLDRCKYIVTGSAPIAAPVLDFYRAAFGIPVVEGYGATETCACAAVTHPYHFSSEHVGGPTPVNELKLVSIPEMNYLVTDDKHNGMVVRGRGEICVRGRCLMNEYYRNPEATAKAIDKDGWYHTGDVGCVLPNGTFKIFDRVGNVFKLSIGEYVAPEKTENVCCRSEFVTAMFAHGDTLHPRMVAVVVPDPAAGERWAKENGIEFTNMKDLCANKDFHKAVLTHLDKVARKEGLQSFEIPKEIHLEPEPFSVDTVLTPTFKMQRKRALEYYAKPIESMMATIS